MFSRIMSSRIMFSRITVVCLFLLPLLLPQADAKNKKKQLLPDDVLRAQRVLIVVHPDAGESVTSPLANRNAADEVERAISRWGRFDLAMESQTADLVIAIRKGNKSGPIISNSPADNRGVVFQPGIGDARIGGQQGRPPDLSSPGPGGMDDRGPRLGAQVFSSDDTFEVYRGRVEYPLDSAPVWRYTAKDALNAPQVTAVEQFRKAIEESEKLSQHKP